LAAPGSANAKDSLGRLTQKRNIVCKGPLAWPQGVRPSRTWIEPIDAVVHQDATAGQCHLRTEDREESLGERHHVALTINHRKVRGAGGAAPAVFIPQMLQTMGKGIAQGLGHCQIEGTIWRP